MQGSSEAVEAAFQADVFAALEYAEQASVTPAVARKRAELLREFEGYLRSVGPQLHCIHARFSMYSVSCTLSSERITADPA